MSTYYSHVSDSTYGTPSGFYVAPPTGNVKDQSGRVVDLTPGMSERSARRVMIHTSQLPAPRDGVYTAKIRPAKGTVAIRLAHAAIPRPMSRVRAQLVLYSIPINSSTENSRLIYQRLCRNTLLANDTSDFPFFKPAKRDNEGTMVTGLDFDWRAHSDAKSDTITVDTNTAQGLWIENTDRTTAIPTSLTTDYSNQLVDIDTLSVMVPNGCGLSELGNAFRNSLNHHTGTREDANNSLWRRFGIEVTDSGFSVYENASLSDHFVTFASLAPADSSVVTDASDRTDPYVARDYYQPIITPITITMNIARSAYINKQSTTGSVFSPNDIDGSQGTIREEYTARPIAGTDITSTTTNANGGIDTNTVTVTSDNFQITIDGNGQRRAVYALHFPDDVTSQNIISVTSRKGIEVRLQSFVGANNNQYFDSTGALVAVPFFIVRLFFGTHETLTSPALIVEHPTGFQTIPVQFANNVVDPNDNTRRLTTMTLDDVNAHLAFLHNGSTITMPNVTACENDNVETTTSITQVSRSYQKSRDIRLGLRWPGKTAMSDFVIESNYSHDSQLITQSTDFARVNIAGNYSGGIARPVRADVASLTQYTVGAPSGSTNAFPTESEINRLMFNNARTTTELADTYVKANPEMGRMQLHPERLENDAHQSDEMMFCGHMMNVTEPAPMAVNNAAVSTSPDLFQPDPTLLTTTPPAGQSTTVFRPESDLFSHPGNSARAPHEDHFYREGLGWETSMTEGATRFVMPAHPVRFTQLDDLTTLSSIYQLPGQKSCTTSINPLVARILNAGSNNSVSFYDLVGQDASGYESVTLSTTDNYKNPLSTDYNILSYYRPRNNPTTGDTNPIVVTIGGENYTIQSARLVSRLVNGTEHAVNLSCDRHYMAQTSQLDPGQSHYFYKLESGPRFRAKVNAKYFSWVFELDRPVNIHSGRRRGASIVGGAVPRVFSGIDDDATMFCPSQFHLSTGRSAVARKQDAPHAFHIRAGASISTDAQPLLLLHGLGDIERPLNSTSSVVPGDVFAVMGTDNDQKKTLSTAADATTWLRSPKTISELSFSFTNAATGRPMDINGNAFLLFDVFCQNE